MDADEFLGLLIAENSSRPGSHQLDPGLTDDELVAWQNEHRETALPEDLIAFLRQCNGFRLYPDPDTPNGCVRLLPLREIDYAPRLLYGGNTSCDESYPSSTIALTDDPDSAQHLILDTATGAYFDVDPIAGLEDDGIVGFTWCNALDWIAERGELRHN